MKELYRAIAFESCRGLKDFDWWHRHLVLDRFYRADQKFSKTTTAHMNMWADGFDYLTVSHDTIVQLVAKLGFVRV